MNECYNFMCDYLIYKNKENFKIEYMDYSYDTLYNKETVYYFDLPNVYLKSLDVLVIFELEKFLYQDVKQMHFITNFDDFEKFMESNPDYSGTKYILFLTDYFKHLWNVKTQNYELKNNFMINLIIENLKIYFNTRY